MVGNAALFLFAFAALGYILGSVMFGVLVGKFFGVDPRQHGSKGAGATNVSRTISASAGILTMVLDAGKAMVAIAICYAIYPFLPATPKWVIFAGGVGAVIGHCLPVFFKFKGGKGVACMGGLLLLADPPVAGVVLGIWLVAVLISEYVSVGSILCAMVAIPLPFIAPLNYFFLLNLENTYEIAGALAAMLAVVFVFIVVMHRKNIVRLAKGEESRAKWPGKIKSVISF